MAVIESVEREVWVLLGVPLPIKDTLVSTGVQLKRIRGIGAAHGPMSDGVQGSEGGGGRLMSVGTDILVCGV